MYTPICSFYRWAQNYFLYFKMSILTKIVFFFLLGVAFLRVVRMHKEALTNRPTLPNSTPKLTLVDKTTFLDNFGGNKNASKWYNKRDIKFQATRKTLKFAPPSSTSTFSNLTNKIQVEPKNTNSFIVEVNVLLDSAFLEALMSRPDLSVLNYLSIFFNAVNKIYAEGHEKDVTFPSVTFRVVHISNLTTREETKIFQVGPDDMTSEILIETVLKGVKKHGKRNKKEFSKYDHTVLITGRDLHRSVDQETSADVLGVAYLQGACSKPSDDKFEAFSVVEDLGAHFLGVYAAVHEFAHNLGVKHDSKKTPQCHQKKGYIMSPANPRTTDNLFQFSSCSLDAMQEFLNSLRGDCLSETNLDSLLPVTDQLPGDMEYITMNKLCEFLADFHYGRQNEIVVSSTVNPRVDSDNLCKRLSCKILLGSSSKAFIYDSFYSPGENVGCDCDKMGNNCEGKCVSDACQ